MEMQKAGYNRTAIHCCVKLRAEYKKAKDHNGQSVITPALAVLWLGENAGRDNRSMQSLTLHSLGQGILWKRRSLVTRL